MNFAKTIIVFTLVCNIFSCCTNSGKSVDTHQNPINKDTAVNDSERIASVQAKVTMNRADTIFFSLNYDLDADGTRDEILVYKIKDSNYLLVNKVVLVNLYTTSLSPITTEIGKFKTLVLLQNKKDKKFEIVVSLQDSVFEDESFVRIYKYQNFTLEQQKFYFSDTSFFDYLIAKNNFLVVNTKKGEIYCCTNTVASDNSTGLEYKIDKYILSENKGAYVFKESKQVNESIFQNPLKIFSYF